MNKLQWNFNQNSNIFIKENALEHVVCDMASILSRPQCVNMSSDLCLSQEFISDNDFIFHYDLIQ